MSSHGIHTQYVPKSGFGTWNDVIAVSESVTVPRTVRLEM